MANLAPTFKRVQIDKANIYIVGAVAIATFIVIFSAVATKALWSRQSYQAKVIEHREKARDQLKANIAAASELTESYKRFVTTTPNAIGGNPSGNAERDGDNAKITLDALPSLYDFPGLTSSVEKLAVAEGLKIEAIEGVDDEANQAQLAAGSAMVEMPFKVTVNGQYPNAGNLLLQFEKSIRPFKITKLIFAGAENNTVDLSIEAKSFYQPARSLEVKKEVVK